MEDASEKNFGILVDREEVIPESIIQENKKSNDLFLWQYKAIKFFFLSGCNVLYNVATGSGKSRLAVELIKEIWKKDPRVACLIVVPKNVILESGWQKELYENGIDLSRIGIYYGKIKEYSQVTVTNMQNLANIDMDLFDIIVLDEAHTYAAKAAYKEITKKEFKYKIGLTATIDRLDREDYKIKEFFNYNIFYYDTGDAIDDKIINNFDFINIGIHLDAKTREEYDELTQSLKNLISVNKGLINLKKNGGKPWFSYLGLITKRKMLVNNYISKFDVAKSICEKHKEDKILVFNQFNEQTNKLYWHLLDVGIQASVMHSGVATDTKQERLADFRMDRINILLTTKMLDEGYNIPKTDVAVIMASDSSNRQLIQRMGRVLRKKNKVSYIYNVYCVDTFEEKNVEKRLLFFRALADNYKDYTWDGALK